MSCRIAPNTAGNCTSGITEKTPVDIPRCCDNLAPVSQILGLTSVQLYIYFTSEPPAVATGLMRGGWACAGGRSDGCTAGLADSAPDQDRAICRRHAAPGLCLLRIVELWLRRAGRTALQDFYERALCGG